MRIICYSILMGFLIGCAHPSTQSPATDGQRSPAAEPPPPAPLTDCRDLSNIKLNQECIPPDEEQKFTMQAERVGLAIQKIARKSGTNRRGFHAKSHGCLRGELSIQESTAGKNYGLFSYDYDKREKNVYPVWARFSNGMPVNIPDAVPDFRGLAIKVLNVDKAPHGAQDFIMINFPTPILKTSEDAVELMEALADMTTKNFKTMVKFSAKHWKDSLSALQLKVPRSVAQETYYSGAPLRLGLQNAVKLRATPCEQNTPTWIGPAAKAVIKMAPHISNPYREDLAMKANEEKGLCFAIEAQFQKDVEQDPIEDASKEWKSTSFEKIGHLRFERQNLKNADRDAFCEQLTFSPWNTIAEHQPLGQVMRARKAIYKESQYLREPAKLVEPNGDENF